MTVHFSVLLSTRSCVKTAPGALKESGKIEEKARKIGLELPDSMHFADKPFGINVAGAPPPNNGMRRGQNYIRNGNFF
jgi:hypothetical protein